MRAREVLLAFFLLEASSDFYPTNLETWDYKTQDRLYCNYSRIHGTEMVYTVRIIAVTLKLVKPNTEVV
jgi:hypothetical protein